MHISFISWPIASKFRMVIDDDFLIFLFFTCIINSKYFSCFWQFFKFFIRHLGKKWFKPEVGFKCIYIFNNNVSSCVWVKFGINRSTCTIWLFLCTNRPYYVEKVKNYWPNIMHFIKGTGFIFIMWNFDVDSFHGSWAVLGRRRFTFTFSLFAIYRTS